MLNTQIDNRSDAWHGSPLSKFNDIIDLFNKENNSNLATYVKLQDNTYIWNQKSSPHLKMYLVNAGYKILTDGECMYALIKSIITTNQLKNNY